jgi:hypothetical protein
MTQQIRPNFEALLLRQVGEVLFGASWQTALAEQISVSDRSMRRWASGEDEIPPGVWRDIHYHAQSQHLTIKYFDEEILRVLKDTRLWPIPNTEPRPDIWGLYFTLATTRGRPIRCLVRREVLDDRVSFPPMNRMLDFFKDHAEVFYRVAQRKFDASEIDDGNLISISNDDVENEGLPDIRKA